MKKGTAVGWLLVAISIVLSVWIISGQQGKAETHTEGDFVVEDTTGELVAYNGTDTTVNVPAQVDSVDVTKIGPNAFLNNADIQTLNIPTSVTSGLDAADFAGCGNLMNINVADGNATYSSSDGCVYSGTTLVIVPPGKGSGVSILATTTAIAENAFVDYGPNEVTITNAVSSIGDQSSWGPGFTIWYSGTPGNDTVATWAVLNGYNYEPLGGGGGGGTTYTVSYNANGGTGTVAAQVEDVGTPVIISDGTGLTNTGKSFTSWNTAADGSGATYSPGDTYDDDTDVTLYAQWADGTTYTVTYNANGGTGTMTPDTFTTGGSVNIKSNTFTRTNYTFNGWNTAANGSGTAYAAGANYSTPASMTLYAQWVENGTQYTVSYNGNHNTGGSTASQTFNAGGSVSINPNGFTKTGYTFVNWNTAANGSGVTYNPGQLYNTAQNLVLYAQWTQLPTYTITYNGNGGTVSGTSTTTLQQSLIQGSSVKIYGKVFQRSGFDLDYWTTNSDGSGTRYNIDQTYSTSANLTLYAHWTATSQQTGASGTPASGNNGTNASSSNTSNSGSGNSGNNESGTASHTKDATPATADGDIDPRIILCVAVAALGIAVIVSSNRRKITYIHSRKDNIEE